MTPRGVVFLDHTADVGFEVDAPGPADLFHRCALAMLALLRGREDMGDMGDSGRGGLVAPADPPVPSRAIRTLALTAPDPARLLADWLRELLFLHELDRLDYAGADFDVLDLPDAPSPLLPCRLDARVRLHEGGQAIREIKGVTYHEILARPTPGGWHGRVIFDV